MLDHTTPESVGINTEIIIEAISYLESQGVPMHSLIVARKGMIAAEIYWKPWNRDKLHRVYSCTKSFVSLAISFLVDDGLIELDDHITDFFPEYLPSPCPHELDDMTIRDMLMMRTCHRRTTYKEGGRGNYIPSFRKDWVRSFFQVAPDHEPGAFFIYDTSSTHVLGALVEKLTGMELLEYLRMKILDELSVDKSTYILKDPEGVSAGGSGLMIRPVDLLSVMDLIRKGGEGKINGDYLKEATSSLSETETGSCGTEADRKCGYGYQFWRMSHNSYAMVGLGGQFAIAVPDKEMTIVTTADTQMNPAWDQDIMKAVWMIVDNAGEPKKENKEKEIELKGIMESLSIPVSKGKAKKSEYYGREFSFKENMLGLESLVLTDKTFSMKVKGSNYSFSYAPGINTLNSFPIPQLSPCYVSGGWLPDDTFALYVQFSGEEQGTLRIQLGFTFISASVLMHLNGEISLEGFEGVASGKCELSQKG